jgi:hypothetical protein
MEITAKKIADGLHRKSSKTIEEITFVKNDVPETELF